MLFLKTNSVNGLIKKPEDKSNKMKYIQYPKRDAIKNYFPMPNEIFSLGLRTGEIALYA